MTYVITAALPRAKRSGVPREPGLGLSPWSTWSTNLVAPLAWRVKSGGEARSPCACHWASQPPFHSELTLVRIWFGRAADAERLGCVG
jgi:hypothetical protein